MNDFAGLRHLLRVGALLVETGVAAIGLTALSILVKRDTWLWYMTKGGNRIAWFIPVAVALAFWLALREKQPAMKRFAIGFHIVFVVVVLAALTVYWMEPFPD